MCLYTQFGQKNEAANQRDKGRQLLTDYFFKTHQIISELHPLKSREASQTQLCTHVAENLGAWMGSQDHGQEQEAETACLILLSVFIFLQ